MKKRLHIVIIYNAAQPGAPEMPDDTGGTSALRVMIRNMARKLRLVKHKVTVLPLAYDLMKFQKKLLKLEPDVIFNQYDDVVHGAFYEMRAAALVRMLGFPITGSPALSLGLCRYKYMSANLLQGVGIPIPPNTELLEKISDVDMHKWRFPIIVQPGQEHAGIGLDRDSIVRTKKDLKRKVKEIIQIYKQPALAQGFLGGREFNVGIVGGRKLRVMPLSEVDYSALPQNIPPIMSYAAKWIENSVEYQKTRVICPAIVDAELTRKITSTALRAFRAVGGWGYGRVDIRLDDEGTPRVLEVNCNPCLDEGMALARSAEKAGISYPQLLDMIIKAALEGPPYDVTIPMLSSPATRPAPPKLADKPASISEVHS
jgi:D-alanine-D-alanine ligase